MLETGSPTDQRREAQTRPDMVNVVERGAATPTAVLRPLGDTSNRPLRPHLGVVAWVNNVAYDKEVWIDLFAFDNSGQIVASESLPLVYRGIASQNGDFFWVNASLPTDPTSEPIADLAGIEYRLYYRVQGTVYTDGILHFEEIPPVL